MAAPLAFLRLVGRLKHVQRAGWVRCGVRDPESVADHMYRMAMASMLLPADGVDRTRCMKMALVHDLSEALVGDITPHDGVSKEEKHRLEREAMATILATVEDAALAEELLQLWEEYEAGESEEAKHVKDLDRLDMVLQADEYEQQQAGLDLSEFFACTKGRFNTETVRAWDEALRAQRAQRVARAAGASGR